MKIALIGPGIMPIPPKGWGAVEILIWDYYNELTSQGHNVTIINTPNKNEIIEKVNSGSFDFVHLHYDCFYDILNLLKCPKIAITSHYPYIDNINKHQYDGYVNIFNFLINNRKYYNFVLAEKDMKTFIQYGADPKYLFKIKNGINSKAFLFNDTPLNDKTIYLGKITQRKNQYKFQHIKNIDFAGNVDDQMFNVKNSNYLGEWDRNTLHTKLTEYSNLLLISDGEADPLVVKEALIAGLGVVVNKSSAENLEETDFITIIDDNRTYDIDYIMEMVEQNKIISSLKRSEIHEYGVNHYDIGNEVKRYIEIIERL